LMELVGGRVKALTQYTMKKDFEQADAVGPYRKSLLYLVSRSFEDQPSMPILGLEESLRRDPEMRDFFGLLRPKTRKAELLLSTIEDGPSHSTISKKHGDFIWEHNPHTKGEPGQLCPGFFIVRRRDSAHPFLHRGSWRRGSRRESGSLRLLKHEHGGPALDKRG